MAILPGGGDSRAVSRFGGLGCAGRKLLACKIFAPYRSLLFVASAIGVSAAVGRSNAISYSPTPEIGEDSDMTRPPRLAASGKA